MDPTALALSVAGLVLAVLVGYALAAAGRGAGVDRLAVDRLQESVDRVAHVQEQLRLEALRGPRGCAHGLLARPGLQGGSPRQRASRR
jgi:hypothetical protein